MVAAIKQTLVLVVSVTMLASHVASVKPSGVESTKELLDWERGSLKDDVECIERSLTSLGTKSESDTLWNGYLKSALERRNQIISEALGSSVDKPLNVAYEILFKAHRKAYAEITPNMEKLEEEFKEVTDPIRYDLSRELDKIEDAMVLVEKCLIKRIDGYLKQVAHKEERESSYHHELDQDSDDLFERAEESDGDDDLKGLFERESKQLLRDYQFVRREINEANPAFMKEYEAMHQIYAALERREDIVRKAMDTISARPKSLKKARSILLDAHKRAKLETKPLLKKASRSLVNGNDYESEYYYGQLKEALQGDIRKRFNRGIKEYSGRRTYRNYDDDDSDEDSDDDDDDDY